MARMLEGKCTMITGAGAGIGRGAALTFARHGAKVAVVDIVPESAEETVRLIKAEGGEAIPIKCNVAVAGEVQAMVDKVAAAFGRLDCAFNNAGVETSLELLANDTEESFDDHQATEEIAGLGRYYGNGWHERVAQDMPGDDCPSVEALKDGCSSVISSRCLNDTRSRHSSHVAGEV